MALQNLIYAFFDDISGEFWASSLECIPSLLTRLALPSFLVRIDADPIVRPCPGIPRQDHFRRIPSCPGDASCPSRSRAGESILRCVHSPRSMSGPRSACDAAGHAAHTRRPGNRGDWAPPRPCVGLGPPARPNARVPARSARPWARRASRWLGPRMSPRSGTPGVRSTPGSQGPKATSAGGREPRG